MFKGRLGVWILTLLLAIGGPWLYEQIPVWFHTDNVVVASELANVDMLDAMSNDVYGHFRVHTTTQEPDVIFTTDTKPRAGYELIENFVYSPMTLFVTSYVDKYESGFIQDDTNDYILKINLHTILVAMEDGSTWQDIGIHRKVLEGKVTLCIPDENDWCYPVVTELFYMTLNGGNTPDEITREKLQPRVEKLLAKCIKCPSIAQAIADEAESPSNGHKAFLAPEYLYMTCEGIGSSDYNEFVPVSLTKTLCISANAYLKTGYTDLDLSHGLFDAMRSKKGFMYETGWRVKDSTFDVAAIWPRLPNVV